MQILPLVRKFRFVDFFCATDCSIFGLSGPGGPGRALVIYDATRPYGCDSLVTVMERASPTTLGALKAATTVDGAEAGFLDYIVTPLW